MTIRVTVTTPSGKQARVTQGADVNTVGPDQTREFCVHDASPTITILEQAVPGASTNRSGGGGRGDPDQK